MKKHLFFAAALLALGSCQKKEVVAPTPAPTPDSASLLTARPWRISAHTTTATPSNGPASTTDPYAATEACERDNFFKFNDDQSLTVDEGASKCNAASPQTTAFAWKLINNQKCLRVTKPDNTSPENNDVLELSAATLRIRTTTTTTTGTVKVENITFTAF